MRAPGGQCHVSLRRESSSMGFRDILYFTSLLFLKLPNTKDDLPGAKASDFIFREKGNTPSLKTEPLFPG